MRDKIVNDKGFISIFVTIVMIFLLVFILTAYSSVNTRLKSQEIKDIELTEIYSENYSDIENYVYADANDVIPIHNIRELNRVGTGSNLQIKDLIYKCGISNSYILKSDIWIDIEEDLMSTNKVDFSDFKLYDTNYTIDKAGNDIFYYYKTDNGSTWKVLAYQKFSKKDQELVKNKTYLQNKFSIVNSFNYQALENKTFMIVWSDKDGALKNLEIVSQDYAPTSLQEIKVFAENYEYIDKETGEFYVLVNI